MREDTYQVEDYDPNDGWTKAAKARFIDQLYGLGLSREEVEAELAEAEDQRLREIMGTDR